MLHALHGNFGLPADWDEALPPEISAKKYNLWEIRRHHTETTTLTGFADWLNHQAESHPGPGPSVLAGYSMGGRLAAHAMLARPDRWQAAILLAPHPGMTEMEDRAARLLHDQNWAETCLHKPWPEVLSAWNSQPVLSGAALSLNPCLETYREEIAAGFSGWSLGKQADLKPLMAHCKVPVLWITGGLDKKFTQLGKQAAMASGNIIHMIIPNCGHRLLQENPERIRTVIRDFLRQI